MRTRISLKCFLLATSALLLPVMLPAHAIAASEEPAESFLPPGALQYDEQRLDNGLRIVSQRVNSAPYVSARLIIKTGIAHYPCRDRELPHLVEHLLFSANSEIPESDIDQRVNSWGGGINAYTYDDQTDLVLDAHARYQVDAVQLLAAMIRDFAPEDADIAREADVVERESGVVHSPLRLWWSALPATQSAATRFSIAAGLTCNDGIPPVHHLRTADVLTAFDSNYVPANMILVLAGDISDAGIAAAREAFSALPAQPAPPVTSRKIDMPAENNFVSGWLSGTANLDAPTAMSLTPFHDWEGYYVLLLVESWLNDRMFRDLRSERGIAYTPAAAIDYYDSTLSISLGAQTESADTAFTREYLQALTEEVRRDGISEEDFEHLRNATLLGMAQSFERIRDRADYMASSVREIDDGGLFQMEDFYTQLDYPRFRALLARDWPERFVVLDNSPRISWSARAWLLAGGVLLLLGGTGLLVWRRLRDARPG